MSTFALRLGTGILPLVVACCVGACAPSLRARLLTDVHEHRIEAAMRRYESLRVDEGPDDELLAIIAAQGLRDEILGDDAERRGAALNALVAAGTSGDETLREIARLATQADVRSRALRTLAQRGDVDALATLGLTRESLVPAGPRRPPIDEAAHRLETLVSAALTLEVGVEMARLCNVLPPEASARVAAEERIARELEHQDAEHRRIALIAAMSLANHSALHGALLRRVTSESDVPLWLSAIALVIDDARAHDHALSRLQSMLDVRSVDAIEAMRLLHRLGDDRALAKLESLSSDPDSTVRKRAVFTLARDCGSPDRARFGLVDVDPFVRIHAAHGILAHDSRRLQGLP